VGKFSINKLQAKRFGFSSLYFRSTLIQSFWEALDGHSGLTGGQNFYGAVIWQ